MLGDFISVILWQSELGQISTFDFIEFQKNKYQVLISQSEVWGESNQLENGTYNFSLFAEKGMALHCVVWICCYKVEYVIICSICWAIGNPENTTASKYLKVFEMDFKSRLNVSFGILYSEFWQFGLKSQQQRHFTYTL